MSRRREARRLAVDVVLHAVRSGQWWTPIVVLALVVAVGVAAATAHVIPVSIYVLF